MRTKTWSFLLATAIQVGAVLTMPSSSWAIDPAASVNAAGMIDFPTALNQTNDHSVAATIDVFDIGEPDLRIENFRYGYQWGDLQLLLDTHALTRPERDFDYTELRVKLRVLPLDELRTTLALGLLGRSTFEDERWARIDDRKASLFFALTNQAYLFGSLPMMTNLYLDNVFASLGVKMEVYQFIMAVLEMDYYHTMSWLEDRERGKIGIEIDGEQNFYFQVFYAHPNKHALIQIGTGF